MARGAHIVGIFLLASCGGEVGASATFTVGGTVSGLVADRVVLTNGTEDLVVDANGPFAFVTRLPSGVTYSVSVKTQPASGEICAATNGGGVVAGTNVTNISVVCGPTLPAAPRGVVAAPPPVGVVTTLAGSGAPMTTDGTGAGASFDAPMAVAVDGADNVYVREDPTKSDAIRKVTSAGVVSTVVAPSPDKLYFVSGGSIALDSAGDLLIADAHLGVVKVTTTGIITPLLVAGCPADAAHLCLPLGIAVASTGDAYVADAYTVRIFSGGVLSTLAGSYQSVGSADGTGSSALFNSPMGIAVDASGNVFVADTLNMVIRKVTKAGVVTTLAGSGNQAHADGTGAAASFAVPQSVAVDVNGNVFVADMADNRIRKVTAAGVVTTLAGAGSSGAIDGTGAAASFNFSEQGTAGIAVDKAGRLYVADSGNSRIRVVTTAATAQLLVSWMAPASTGGADISGYTASASSAGQPTLTCTASTATTCLISGLTSGVAYSVSVFATSSVGNSAASTPVSATPD